MTFGERLRALRKEKGYRQCELAERIGTDQNNISRYEQDKTQPSLSMLEWLCMALEVSSTELLGF